MSFFDKIKAKMNKKKTPKVGKTAEKKEGGGGGGGEVHILPVPGADNTNQPPQVGGGLNSNPEWEAHKGPGPVIPTAEMASALEEPKTREELHARAEALNAGS